MNMKMNMKSVCVLLVILCLFGGSVFADVIIQAVESCRTDILEPDTNKHNSSKLSVRESETNDPPKSVKSWIKFNLYDSELGGDPGLNVNMLKSATVTVSLHEGKDDSQYFDVSAVNDDHVDNIGWDERSLTWNNAPGNDTANYGALDATETTFLSHIEFIDGLAGDSFVIDVLAILQADTDGIVQIVLHNSDNLLQFATHDHDTYAWRPFLDIVEIHLGANDPVPGDGESVETSLAELSWLNPDPCDIEAGITCDVYLGTDPNRLTMDKVTLAVDANSVVVNATNFPTFVPLVNKTTYYWIVDCQDNSGGGNSMPGLTWSFYTDNNLTPAVNAGADQIAWLGKSGTPGQEVISLDGTTSDVDGLPDPPAAYTVEWTQVDNGAPVVVISPDDTDDTSVTITARGTYEFMLTADDGGKTNSDTVEIFVGDDTCDASHLSTGDDYNVFDENEDCLVGLQDLAAFAAIWLDCSDTLTNCGN